MRRFRRLFGPKDELPWLRTPSIAAHIRSHVDPQTGKLDPAGDALPDDERHFAGSAVRWAPGAMDGVFGGAPEAEENQTLARSVAGHVAAIARTNSEDAKIRLYRMLLEDHVLGFIDPVLELIVDAGVPISPYLHPFARFLAEHAPDRGPVKFGIALLGLIGDQRDVDIVLLLGLHDEFSLYAAVAISNMLPDPEPAIWQLARLVEGWGRVHLVERLATTSTAEIKDWLLREGYRNSIMNEYLAFACATGGDLKAALLAPTVDDTLIDAAGEIIEALIQGGPAENIDDYADAAIVLRRYVELVASGTPRLGRFLAVSAILRYLEHEHWDPGARAANGWTQHTRAELISLAQGVVRDSQWPPLVTVALQSTDLSEAYRADQAARVLGIDTWDVNWRRLQAEPLQSGHWYQIMRDVTPARIRQVVDFALAVLPLDEVATGPAHELGLGPRFEVHSCVEFILLGLGAFPGVGWPLVDAALRSPVVRQRHVALGVLADWGQDLWTHPIRDALHAAEAVEPNAEVRKHLGNVLRGEPYDASLRWPPDDEDDSSGRTSA